MNLLLEAGLEATTVRTERPLWTCNLYDIAVWHGNLNLVSADGLSLHPALRRISNPPTYIDFQMEPATEGSGYGCDGCQPTDVR